MSATSTGLQRDVCPHPNVAPRPRVDECDSERSDDPGRFMQPGVSGGKRIGYKLVCRTSFIDK